MRRASGADGATQYFKRFMKSDHSEFRGQSEQVIANSSGDTQQMTRPEGIPCTRTVPPRSPETAASGNCYLLAFPAEIRFTILDWPSQIPLSN
jgi:hypothetical protein